jgi:eight-cysteine-cluster-containing protein
VNKFFSNFILISSALIMSASIAFYLSYQSGNFDPTGNSQLKRVVYQNEEGNPKYSQGDCEKDSDCTPAGCSSHICSNNPDLITTCEYSKDYPSEDEFDCGCVDNQCVWYKEK